MYRNNVKVFITLSMLLLIGGCASLDKGPIRVGDYTETIRLACIGDSITYGAGIRDRATKSYPAQLGKMLGDKWNVRNFGISGATMLKKSNKPYWNEKAFANALAFNPHVVVIKLGTNDSKSHWNPGGFEADYTEMIDTLAALKSKPRIWLCLPVPAYEERWEIRDSVIRGEVIGIIKTIAEARELPVIDLYTALGDKEEIFPDKIHPNAEGAKLMAEEIKLAVAGK